MKHILSTVFLALALLLSSAAHAEEPAARFVPVDVMVDTGGRALAAFQIELRVVRGQAEIVGIEGGAHPAFREPAFYDPAALAGARIILAAFSTAPELPTGGGRLATVHLREPAGPAAYHVEVIAAVDRDGKPINARFELRRRENSP